MKKVVLGATYENRETGDRLQPHHVATLAGRVNARVYAEKPADGRDGGMVDAPLPGRPPQTGRRRRPPMKTFHGSPDELRIVVMALEKFIDIQHDTVASLQPGPDQDAARRDAKLAMELYAAYARQGGYR
jgi:hypothetical protein